MEVQTSRAGRRRKLCLSKQRAAVSSSGRQPSVSCMSWLRNTLRTLRTMQMPAAALMHSPVAKLLPAHQLVLLKPGLIRQRLRSETQQGKQLRCSQLKLTPHLGRRGPPSWPGTKLQ